MATQARESVAGRRQAEPISILVVDDCDDDAQLILRELRRGGYEPAWKCVDSAPALRAALERGAWDVITCDYVMPGFGGMEALAIIQELAADVPVILVSGEVGEEVAVDAMKAGAHDFVGKHRLARLVPAIRRELRDAAERRARREAEAALRASEQRYRELVESSHDVTWAVDAAGRGTFLSRAVRHILGYEPEELLDRPFTDFMPPEEAARALTFFDQIKAGTGTGTYETEMVRKDGGRVFLSANIKVLRDEQGTCIGTTGIAVDVTERRRAEEALQRSQANLRAILNNSLQSFVLLDATGTIKAFNQIASVRNELLFLTGPLREGRPLYDYLPEADRAGFHRNFMQALRGEAAVECEHRVRDRHGEECWFEINFVSVLDDDGSVSGVCLSAIDITERRRAEAALRASETRLRVAMEAAHMAAWEWDIARNQVAYSDNMGPMFGLPPGASFPTYSAFLDAVHPADRDRLSDALRRAMEDGADRSLEFRTVWPDGTVHWIGHRGAILRDADGRLAKATGVAMDITERKQAEAERARLVAAVEQAPEAIIIVDAAGAIVYANAACERLTGYTRGQLCGPRGQLLRPDEAIEREIRKTLTRGETWRGSVVQRHRNGTVYEVDVIVSPVSDASGEVISYVTLVRDVSQRAA